MRNIQSINGVSVNKVSNLIFDASRANENREPKTVSGYNVRFSKQPTFKNTEYMSEVFCANGLIGSAIVDQFDI